MNITDKNLVLSLDSPMALPTLQALRRFMIQEGGYRDMVVKIDQALDRLLPQIDEFQRRLESRQESIMARRYSEE